MDFLLQLWKDFSFTTAFLVLFSYVIIDALYAAYTIYTAHYREYRAATAGSLIYFLTAFGIISYTKNYLYILPMVIGSWLGTFLMVRKEKNRSKNLKQF